MANVYAVKSGNWSDTTVWNTGALPTSADDVYANGYTVTINTSPTVLSIRNTAASPIVEGGSFVPTDGITLTCTGLGVVAGALNGRVFASSLSTGQSSTVVSNVVSGVSKSGSVGIENLSTGTVNVVGDVVGGANNRAYATLNDSSGTLNIVGSAQAGTGNQCYGVYNASTGTVNITGTVAGANSNNTSPVGAWNNSTGTINITGDVSSGSGANANGAWNNSTGNMTITGSMTAVTTAAIGLGNLSQNTFLTGPFIGTAQGVSANVAARWRWIPSVGASYMTAVNSDATGYKNLYTADSTDSESGQPAASNVRSGTVYGPNSELTGACAVPAAGSVAFGVPVDATTGTAVLTPESVRSAVGLASANLDTQLSRLANAATTQEVADIVEGAAAQP